MDRIEKNILEKIKNGEVKMKPKWWFTGRMLGIRLMYWMIVAGAGLGVAATIQFFDMYRPNELWDWWQLSPDLITEDFPLWQIVGFIGCLLLGVIVLSNIGENYKRANKFWLLVTTMTMLVVGLGFFLLKIRV